jgi:hypothetical protein
MWNENGTENERHLRMIGSAEAIRTTGKTVRPQAWRSPRDPIGFVSSRQSRDSVYPPLPDHDWLRFAKLRFIYPSVTRIGSVSPTPGPDVSTPAGPQLASFRKTTSGPLGRHPKWVRFAKLRFTDASETRIGFVSPTPGPMYPPPPDPNWVRFAKLRFTDPSATRIGFVSPKPGPDVSTPPDPNWLRFVKRPLAAIQIGFVSQKPQPAGKRPLPPFSLPFHSFSFVDSCIGGSSHE